MAVQMQFCPQYFIIFVLSYLFSLAFLYQLFVKYSAIFQIVISCAFSLESLRLIRILLMKAIATDC